MNHYDDGIIYESQVQALDSSESLYFEKKYSVLSQ